MDYSADTTAAPVVADLAKKASKPERMLVSDPRSPQTMDLPIGIKTESSGGGAAFSLKPLLDEWRDAPDRRSGTANVITLESFIDLVIRHKDADSALFATVSPATLTAVIDYHRIVDDAAESDLAAEHEIARFGKHRVHYKFPMSEQATAWMARNGKEMSQGELAEFIEENIADLSAATKEDKAVIDMFRTTAATPAELMLLSREFRIKVEATITENRVLQSGEAEIGYTETHKSGEQGAKGKFTVPGAFVIAIPLFEDDDPTRIVARLRYRVRDGKISWLFNLYKLRDTITARVKACVDAAKQSTQLPAYFGTPEA